MSTSHTERVLLPPNVEPSKYSIKLVPDLISFVYSGEETVAVDVVTATDTISVHSRDIAVQEVTFAGASGKPVTATELSFNLKLMTLTIKFGEELPVGAGSLYIKFTGTLNDQMAGFYRSEYKSVEGEKRIMASTQFEALDARRYCIRSHSSDRYMF
jgi:aminopeptidase N